MNFDPYDWRWVELQIFEVSDQFNQLDQLGLLVLSPASCQLGLARGSLGTGATASATYAAISV